MDIIVVSNKINVVSQVPAAAWTININSNHSRDSWEVHQFEALYGLDLNTSSCGQAGITNQSFPLGVEALYQHGLKTFRPFTSFPCNGFCN